MSSPDAPQLSQNETTGSEPRLGGDTALLQILAALRDAPSSGRANAGRALVEIMERDPDLGHQAIPELRDLLDSARIDHRIIAAWVLGHVAQSDIAAELVTSLLPHMRARSTTMRWITLNSLIRLIPHLADEEVRQAIINEMIYAIDDSAALIRDISIRALGFIGDERAIPGMREHLSDPAEPVSVA
ncbi:MAG: hypothetical protein GYB68_11605, partial [Chloroflexi bacterium]|nr:hypothetical protein [Chloroflexota bacterium]